MSAFLDHFVSDREMDDVRRSWVTVKPLFKNSVVTYAPPYPEYPKLKLPKKSGPHSDPSCSSARVLSSELEVMIYSESAQGYGSHQERAWEYILQHAATIETQLRRKLFAKHTKYLTQFREEELPHSKEHQKYWKVIEANATLDAPSAVDQFFKLVGIGLADHGLDECGFSSFEFQTGWDRDHGLGIVLHKDRVLAAGGLTELIYGSSIVEGLKCVQDYDLDEGDYSLLDSK
jgi:hypothetical protein